MRSTRPGFLWSGPDWDEAYRDQCAEFERLVLPFLDGDRRAQAKRLPRARGSPRSRAGRAVHDSNRRPTRAGARGIHATRSSWSSVSSRCEPLQLVGIESNGVRSSRPDSALEKVAQLRRARAPGRLELAPIPARCDCSRLVGALQEGKQRSLRVRRRAHRLVRQSASEPLPYSVQSASSGLSGWARRSAGSGAVYE